ncbi:MAG: tetratricopeptide repeat protein [Bdellovibrionales bacterium]
MVDGLIMIVLVLFMQTSFAVKMDQATHNEVIRRLEIGLESMDKNAEERPGILLRLADLYADRARLQAMAGDGPSSREDRRIAIRLYTEAMPKAPAERQGDLLLQVAHLHTMNGRADRAHALYQSITQAPKNKYTSETRGLAYTNLAELSFKKGEFRAALKLYDRARQENLRSRAFVEYRRAWCLFNLGQLKPATAALIALLNNPDWLRTSSTNGDGIEPGFVQDVSSDLARFLARGPLTTSDIQRLRQLSPDEGRRANLKTLAEEAERLGKKKQALAVWAAYVEEGEVDHYEKLEVQTRLARLHLDLDLKKSAVQMYNKALALYTSKPCADESRCAPTRDQMKRFLTSWHKSLGKGSSPSLFACYKSYSNAFADAEVAHWGAQLGADLKRYKEAGELFHRSADLAGDKKAILEGSLLGEISMAESLKSSTIKETAYNHYLQLQPQGPKAWEVRYQRAHLYFETKRFVPAFQEFHALITSTPHGPAELRAKAADLALDSLVAQKDDTSLETRAIEYARLIPSRKLEYLKLSRQATLNRIAGQIQSKNTQRPVYLAGLADLNKINLEGADAKERAKILRNKIVLSEKAGELETLRDSLSRYLALADLSAKDRDWAITKKIWVAEMQLNFGEAYDLSKKATLKTLSPANRELRLALLADLAGRDSRPHNKAYLRFEKNPRLANLARVTLVRQAKNRWRELDRHLRSLRLHPDLLADLALEVFASEPNYSKASRLLKTTRIGRYPSGQTLARHVALRDFQSFDQKIARHKIFGYSEAVMKKTIRERLRLIGMAERNLQEALNMKDWTLQALSIGMLARENRRLYHDILALPIPRRLSPADRNQYQSLLKAQSDPYLQRAERLESRLKSHWGGSATLHDVQTAYRSASQDIQKLYAREMKSLIECAPPHAQNHLKDLLSTPYRKPSQRDILIARRALQEQPFDLARAQALRDLESKAGRASMVVFLDQRIDSIKKGTTL